MRGFLKVFGFLASFAVVFTVGGAFHFWVFLNSPGSPVATHRIVTITPGMSFRDIARDLHKAGIVSNTYLFCLLARVRHLTNRIQTGEYEFSTLLTPNQVISRLARGRVILHRVTFPEGSTLMDVARILGRAQIADEKEIISLARDGEFARSLGIKADSLEGYLFPNTYYFRKPSRASEILREMVHQFQTRAIPKWYQRAKEMEMTLHEVVILASIVEKEAMINRERPIIAAVFLNRLKIGMPLQSDPTAVYGLPNFSGPITPRDLTNPSPYNTYLHKGLPIGPICNPGERSIKAVLYPASVPYLYFVSNGDGTHSFSKTYSGHLAAIAKMRKKIQRKH